MYQNLNFDLFCRHMNITSVRVPLIPVPVTSNLKASIIIALVPGGAYPDHTKGWSGGAMVLGKLSSFSSSAGASY